MNEDEPWALADDGDIGPYDGELLDGRWRLGRRIARGPAGDLYDAEQVSTGAPVAVWTLPPQLGSDPGTLRLLGRMALSREADGLRPLEIVPDGSLGFVYAVMHPMDVRAPNTAESWRSFVEALMAERPLSSARGSAASAPPPSGWSRAVDAFQAWSAAPATRAVGPPGSLDWLRERRLAAAWSGGAPLVTSRPHDSVWDRPTSPAEVNWSPDGTPSAAAPAPPLQAWPATAPPPPPTMAGAAPPTRRRGPHPALWGSAAAVGALVLGSAALLQTGAPRLGASNAPVAASQPPMADTAPGPPEVGAAGPADATEAIRNLAGSWSRSADCSQLTRLAVSDDQLREIHADGSVEDWRILRVEPGGGVLVRTDTGDVAYRADGDTLVMFDPHGGVSRFTRCPQTSGAANAAGVAGEAALIAMAMAGAAAPEPPPVRDEVDVSAFAPKQMCAGGVALVQIYMHLIDQAEAAEARAQAADPQAALRGQTTLGLELARGARVDIMLDAGGLGLDEPIQSVIWRGRPCAAQFAVSAPAGASLGQRVLTARLLVDGVPLGRLAFTLTLAPAEPAVAAHPDLTGDFAKRYGRAFLSYSSLDRPEVLKTVQTLRATGIDYFQDILSIEPGAEWRERLFAEIDRCDLFLLFWSTHAAGSDWVRQEAEYALARRHGSREASPDIRPIILEGPPIPLPPPSLAELHFNDMLRYVVVASELEARARRAPEANP